METVDYGQRISQSKEPRIVPFRLAGTKVLEKG